MIDLADTRDAEAVALAYLRSRDEDLARRHAAMDAAAVAVLRDAWSTPGWGRRVRNMFLGLDRDGAATWDPIARDYDPDLTLAQVFTRNCEVREIDLDRTPPELATRDRSSTLADRARRRPADRDLDLDPRAVAPLRSGWSTVAITFAGEVEVVRVRSAGAIAGPPPADGVVDNGFEPAILFDGVGLDAILDAGEAEVVRVRSGAGSIVGTISVPLPAAVDDLDGGFESPDDPFDAPTDGEVDGGFEPPIPFDGVGFDVIFDFDLECEALGSSETRGTGRPLPLPLVNASAVFRPKPEATG